MTLHSTETVCWIFSFLLYKGIARGSIVIKPCRIQGQPIYSGYFELSGCGTIGQVWVTAIAEAISLTALLCFKILNTVMTPLSSLMMMMLIKMMLMRMTVAARVELGMLYVFLITIPGRGWSSWSLMQLM